MIGTDGAVWTANESFCSLVRLDESALRHLGWRQLVHAADRRYVAAHLVEVLAGGAHLREFDVRLVPPDGEDVPTRLRVELGARQRRAPGLVPRGGLGHDVGSRPRWTWSTERRTPRGLELPPLVVREPLEEFLDGHGIGAGRVEAERIGEGHSNITFLVRRGDARVVLRRPPRPPLPPSAHDVLREARLLRALEGTPVRVPKVLAVGDDESVLGVPFYVMEEMHGSVLGEQRPGRARHPGGAPPDRRRSSWTRWSRCTTWTGRRAASRATASRPATSSASCAASRACGSTTRRASSRSSRSWATGSARTCPSRPESTIVHGDYRLGNVMMADTAPAELVAIFDWELSTIGDPLADVGYLTVTWVEPDDPEDTMFANLNAVTRRDGFPTREELIARYEERTGRSVSALNWYQALALWKAAVFMEGNYKRFQAGNSDDEYLGLFDRGVPMLAEKAREIAHG